MMILKTLPPNFSDIVKVFPMARKQSVIFSYAPHIHYPAGGNLPRCLIEHEKVHITRQGNDPAAWWSKYLTDVNFRWDEEVIAHRVEYKIMAEGLPQKRRELALRHVAKRLAGPLYGHMVKTDQAMELIAA